MGFVVGIVVEEVDILGVFLDSLLEIEIDRGWYLLLEWVCCFGRIVGLWFVEGCDSFGVVIFEVVCVVVVVVDIVGYSVEVDSFVVFVVVVGFWGRGVVVVVVEEIGVMGFGFWLKLSVVDFVFGSSCIFFGCLVVVVV